MDKKMVTHYPVSQHHIRYIIPLVAIQKKKSRDEYAIYPSFTIS